MSVAVHHQITPGPTGSDLLVLSNSLGSTLESWDRNVAALAEHFTVLRYDVRGHGRSPVVPGPATLDDLVDDLLELLETLTDKGYDTSRVHLAGLSLGGMTVLRMAAREPHRVLGVVGLCTSAKLTPASAWTERAATVRAQGTGAVAEGVVNRWYTPEFLASQSERVQAAHAVVAATPAEGYAACCEAIAEMDLNPDLPKITAPTLVISGADDPAMPPEHQRNIADHVADGRLLIVDRAAHLANDEQPEQISAAMVEHLRAAAGHVRTHDDEGN